MKKFGEFLIEQKVVTTSEIEEALDVQRYRPLKIGRVLKDLGVLDSNKLNDLLCRYFFVASSHSLEEVKSMVLSERFSSGFRSLCSKFHVLPLAQGPLQLKIVSTTFDDEILNEIEATLGSPVDVQIVDQESFDYLDGYYTPKTEEESRGLKQGSSETGIFRASPYSSLFLDLVRDAKAGNVSDIHIQPTREGVEIRFRVDGDMKQQLVLPLEHRRSFVNEVKRLAGLSVAVSGKPQDGRVSFNDWQLDLRSSLLPSQFGEKLVLRLLDRTRKFELPVLGFDEDTEHDLREILEEKSGVVVVSGPTGSGKTTTLYTLLSEIDRKSRNVLTLEDPIEYSIDGLTQVQVGPKLSFAQALRSVLRQDPDVILVGEIRDAETADLCIKAASTGHLVLSTVHANGAADVVGRLINLGVDRYLLKSVLKLSSAQRLVKRLCTKCSLPLSNSEIANLGRVLTRDNYKGASGLRKRNDAGCEACRSGVTGRVSVLEYAKGNGLGPLFQEEPRTDGLSASLQSAYLARALKGEVDANEYRKVG